jgi:hypothetical protein
MPLSIQIRNQIGHSERYSDSYSNLRELVGDNESPHLYSQEKQKLCLYKPGKGSARTAPRL